MDIIKLALVAMVTLALTPTAFANGLAHDVDTLEGQVSALQTENAALQGVISSLTSIVEGLVEQQRCHARPDTLQADDTGGYLGGVNWSGCDKTGLSMWGPRVGGAVTENLTNADLRFVNFTLANLIGIEARGVDLEGATFVKANLAFSNFVGANVIPPGGNGGLDEETIFIDTTCPDTTSSDENGNTCFGHMDPNPDP